MNIFAKHSILDVWEGSEYASGLLKLFCHDSKRQRDAGMFDIVFTPNLKFSPCSEVTQGSTKFKLGKD